MERERLKNLIDASAERIPCDVVLRNVTLANMFTGRWMNTDLALKDGYVVGFGSSYKGTLERDLEGALVTPSLMDSHIHIESTLATPREFSRAAIAHGVTAVIMDPHEIANVLGTAGLDFMLASAQNLPVNFYVMLSSSVPSTIFETSGATLTSKDLESLYQREGVLGLAEVMDLDAVKSGDTEMLEKILASRNRNLVVDGHGASLGEVDSNVYRTAGIATDHECTRPEEALDRLSKGMYIHIREGSVAKNFDALIPLVTKENLHRFTFCTDDIYIDDLNETGSIDAMVRRAIAFGMDPMDAIRIAAFNPAQCYQLRDHGAVAPGYKADFLILEDLASFSIREVYKDGIPVYQNGQVLFDYGQHQAPPVTNTVHLSPLTLEDFQYTIQGQELHVIGIQRNSLLTDHHIYPIQTPFFESDVDRDLMKLMVIERHGHGGGIGKSIVQGFRMREGAVATTVAHDSHNIVVMGANDQDMLLAVQRLQEMGGGIAVAREGAIVSELQLDIAGLISSASMEDISADLKSLHAAAHGLFNALDLNPFLTLSFLTLPVIPELKVTDKGLFSSKAGNFIPLHR